MDFFVTGRVRSFVLQAVILTFHYSSRPGYLAETEPLFSCLKTLKIFDINLYQTAFFMQKIQPQIATFGISKFIPSQHRRSHISNMSFSRLIYHLLGLFSMLVFLLRSKIDQISIFCFFLWSGISCIVVENQTKICSMLRGIAWELFDIVCCSIMHAHCCYWMTFKITSKVNDIELAFYENTEGTGVYNLYKMFMKLWPTSASWYIIEH